MRIRKAIIIFLDFENSPCLLILFLWANNLYCIDWKSALNIQKLYTDAHIMIIFFLFYSHRKTNLILKAILKTPRNLNWKISWLIDLVCFGVVNISLIIIIMIADKTWKGWAGDECRQSVRMEWNSHSFQSKLPLRKQFVKLDS